MRQMVALELYKYEVHVCYALVESTKFFKRIEETLRVQEGMKQFLRLCKKVKGNWWQINLQVDRECSKSSRILLNMSIVL